MNKEQGKKRKNMFKERSLAQWTNYAFFAIGLACLLILPYTVNTYISYAEDGYGIDVELDYYAMWVTDTGIQLYFDMENPGNFDVLLINASLIFTSPQNETFHQQINIDQLLERNAETQVFTQFQLPQDIHDMLASGEWQLDVRFILYVEPRDVWLPLTFQHTEGVV